MIHVGIASIKGRSVQLHVRLRDDAGWRSLSAIEDTIRAMRVRTAGGNGVSKQTYARGGPLPAWHKRLPNQGLSIEPAYSDTSLTRLSSEALFPVSVPRIIASPQNDIT